MSGDNMHGTQPEIRYNVNVHHHEEWEEMTLNEKLEVLAESIKKWESEYLKDHRQKLSKQQIELLEGRPIKSHEGMIYGQMYSTWKNEKGINLL